MNRQFIVTDLTRFNTDGKVCLAGIEEHSNTCLRPMPYFSGEECRSKRIIPGTLLQMDLEPKEDTQKPHVEDMSRTNNRINVQGTADTETFLAVLKNSCVSSINEAFDGGVPDGEKYIPLDAAPHCSLISIQIDPKQIQIVEDSYKPGKLKVHIKDNHRAYKYLPITDLGFHNYAMANMNNVDAIADINHFFKKQEQIYLRIGLSREYKPNSPNDTRHGFWIQVNGIYTFPDILPGTRAYS